ncbi:MAG: hypothetical protein AAFQ36_00780 [Pseudomonadota bacterium]
MKRRHFLTATSTVGAAALAAPALGQGRLSISIGNVWSQQTDGRGELAARLAARIEGLSGGTITVSTREFGGLASDTMLAALRAGEVNAVLGAEENWMELHPAFGVFTSLPGGLVERELEAWFRVGRGQDAWDTFAAEYDLKSHYIGDTGAEYAWTRAALTGTAMLDGLTVATRGLAADIYSALGARVRPQAAGVVNPGDVELAETGPVADTAQLPTLGFGHLTLATATRPSSALSLTFTKSSWDGLTEEQRRILEASAMAESHIVAAQGMKRNAVSKQIFRLVNSVSVTNAPQPVFDAMLEASRDRFSELEGQDDATRSLLREYRNFGEAVQVWTRVADAPFTLSRARNAAAG